MFKSLREKLKKWKDKVVEEFSEKEVGEEKKIPKTKEKSSKKETKKTPKIEKKEIKKSSKKEKKKKIPSKKTQKEKKEKTLKEKIIKEPIEKSKEIEPKKEGFFKKLFSHKEEEIEEESSEKSEEIIEEEPQEKKSFLDKFKKKITEEKFFELFQELELEMLQNNVSYEAVQFIKENLSKSLVGKNLSEISLEEKLREAIEEILINPPSLIEEIKESLKEKKPFVIAFVGINGSGKTTSIAKVANLLKKEKLSICLAAADTFRAAAIEQLEIHANNLEIPIIKKDYNSDPASVGFEAIAYAKKHGIDVVLIDTAGRMNTKDSLMKEMEKIIRVCNPDKKIFLGESITGNDATEQARAFNDSISIDGIILSKADIDERGGTALSVSYITKKPIYFLGVGQSYDDLEVFDKEIILKRLGL